MIRSIFFLLLFTCFCSISFGQNKITYQLDFDDSLFVDEVVLREVVIERDFEGASAIFQSLADFTETRFNGNNNFGRSTFYDSAIFTDSYFRLNTWFTDAVFKGQTSFYSSAFGSSVSFRGTKFFEDVIFGGTIGDNSISRTSGSQFAIYSSFDNAHFHKKAIFRNTKFKDNTFFENAIFESVALFDNSIFYKNADFTGVTFKKEANFNWVIMPDTLVLDYIKLSHPLDLTNTINKAEVNCKISLVGVDLSLVKIDYSKFDLIFYKNSERRLSPMLRDTISELNKTNIYEKLLRAQTPYPAGYKKLDIEYSEFRYSKRGAYGFFLNYLDKYWWNYGYNKEYIFTWTLYLLILFTLINSLFFGFLNKGVYKIDNVWNASPLFNHESKQLKMKKKAQGFIRNLPHAFFYTCLIFFGLKMKIEELQFKHKIAVTYILFVFVSGLICTVFMANFVFSNTN